MSKTVKKYKSLEFLLKRRTKIGHEIYTLQLRAQSQDNSEVLYNEIFDQIEQNAKKLEVIEHEILKFEPQTGSQLHDHLHALLDILARNEQIDEENEFLQRIRDGIYQVRP